MPELVCIVPCRECEELERNYERAIRHIKAAVQGNYSSVAERLHDLRRWQNQRDKALRKLYKHKHTHARKKPSDSVNEDAA